MAATKLKTRKSRNNSEKPKPPTLADIALRISMGAPLNTEEAALYLGLSVGTLHIYRCRGEGPHCEFAGSRPRYTKSALDAWVASGKPKQTVTP